MKECFAKTNPPPWVFSTFLKLWKLSQIVRSVTFVCTITILRTLPIFHLEFTFGEHYRQHAQIFTSQGGNCHKSTTKKS